MFDNDRLEEETTQPVTVDDCSQRYGMGTVYDGNQTVFDWHR